MLLFQYIYIYMENGTTGKRQLLLVCCRWKAETVNIYLFSVNGKWKRNFCFLWSANDRL